jgi:hypothetical protein
MVTFFLGSAEIYAEIDNIMTHLDTLLEIAIFERAIFEEFPH